MQGDSRFMAPPSIRTLLFNIPQGDATGIALGIYFLVAWLWFLLVFRNRNRPVLEIRDGKISCASVFALRRKPWRVEDVAEVCGVSRLTGILRLRL